VDAVVINDLEELFICHICHVLPLLFQNLENYIELGNPNERRI
jgi:hypothetical protein